MRSILIFVLSSAAAFAGTITTTGATNGSPFSIVDVTGFSTTGDQMAGLLVTGNFSTGGNVVCLWAATGVDSGGCSGTTGSNSFSLALSGDTFSSSWILNGISTAVGASLQSLVFNGPAGFTVFDRTSPSPGTPGSSSGRDANGSTNAKSGKGEPAAVNGVATYSNIVSVGANAALADLYAQVTIVFGAGGAGLTAGQSADFLMDTDSIGLRGDVPGSGVPEPSTLALIGGGLLGLAAFRRKRSF